MYQLKNLLEEQHKTTSRCSILRQTIRGLCSILDVRIAIYNLEHNLYKEQAPTLYQGLLIMLRT